MNPLYSIVLKYINVNYTLNINAILNKYEYHSGIHIPRKENKIVIKGPHGIDNRSLIVELQDMFDINVYIMTKIVKAWTLGQSNSILEEFFGVNFYYDDNIKSLIYDDVNDEIASLFGWLNQFN